MSYTINDLKTDVTGRLHGTTLNKVSNIDEVIQQAGRKLLLDIDPMETKRISQITNAIYSDIYDYTLPTDVKGNKIVDIRPQANRDVSDNFSQAYTEDFDINKTNNTLNIRYNNGNKSLRLSKAIRQGVTVNELDTVDENGTWVAGGDAGNLAQDKLNKIAGTASLRFDLDGTTGSGYIETSDMDAKDLTNFEDVGALFEWLNFPAALVDNLTSIDLRWGDSNSVYWNKTVTTAQDTTAFQTGWNLLRHDWSDATEAGSPDVENVIYLRITVNYTAGTAYTAIRADNVIARLGQIYDIEYYSKYLYRNTSDTWLEKFTDDTDIINLDVDSYNLLLDKTSELVAIQTAGEDSVFDSTNYEKAFELGKRKYKQTYKSEFIKQQANYYNQSNQQINS